MPKVLTEDRELWRFCRKTMFIYADRFGLRLKKVKPLPATKEFYGDCSGDGHVRIQLRRGTTPLLPYQIIDTMAHELAHLRHLSHKPAWFRLHVKILAEMEYDDVFKQLRRLQRSRG